MKINMILNSLQVLKIIKACEMVQGPDHALRYLSIHDNKFLRYLKGHSQKVTSLGVAPKSDLIMSTSQVSCSPFAQCLVQTESNKREETKSRVKISKPPTTSMTNRSNNCGLIVKKNKIQEV
jgi:hypothetical protein